MNKTTNQRYYKLIFFTFSLLLLCSYSLSFAEEQRIAESFGLFSKGSQYYHSGRLIEAKEILEKAVELDPRNEDARVYLNLVKAELKLRARGKLNSYEDSTNLKRETDLKAHTGMGAGIGVYGKEEEDSGDKNSKPLRPLRPKDKVSLEDNLSKKNIDSNEPPAKGRIKGEYKMSLGATEDDLIWKKANGDYNERNFRMIDHGFQQTNTYDTRVFDKFKAVFDTNTEDTGVNFHSDVTVDPWSFVGKTDKFTVRDTIGTDLVDLEFKYWSATGSTINETVYTTYLGDSIDLSEYKVSDGKLPSFTVNSQWKTFNVPKRNIIFTFQPVRELWLDFKGDKNKLRIFPLGYEDQAFTSDDPMGLSNHHIYWEPSPWLDDWIPGHVNTGRTPKDFWRGEWSDDLSFFTRDSDLKRLTGLRGVSFEGEFLDNTNISTTIASPKTLWQVYDNITAIPGAVRTKTQLTDSFMIGTIDAFRIGYVNDNKVDSYNNVIGVDMSYDLNPTTNIVGEAATSKSAYDRTSLYQTSQNGAMGHLAIKKKTELGDARIAFTHMDEAFDAGLTNYKETRRDLYWGRHIHFKKPFEYITAGSTPLKYDDIDPFRIGDGIDSGRNVLNFRLNTNEALDERMDNLIDYRYVRDTEDKYVEGVFREENTYKLNPEWTSKLLFLYHDLPKTKGGRDPIQYDTDTGEYMINAAIEDKKDPSLSTYSAGLEYAPEDWISIFGIYENTNDFTFATGDIPRRLLNDSSFNSEIMENRFYRKENYFLYNQGYFNLPPYDHFNIYRVGLSLKPIEPLGIELDYTKNDFKFAQGIDDNLNHIGAAVRYDFTKKLTGFLKYTYSKAYNLYRLNTSGDLKYQGHHNMFAEVDYEVSKDGFFVFQFGEGSFYGYMPGPTLSPFGDFYPTLDTQHIVRLYYNGKF